MRAHLIGENARKTDINRAAAIRTKLVRFSSVGELLIEGMQLLRPNNYLFGV